MGRGRLDLNLRPRYRISDKLNINLTTELSLLDKDRGFVDYEGASNTITFGQRNRNTIVNSLGGNYIFNNKMALNLAFRHYFTEVNYNQFFNLQPNGELQLSPGQANNYDTTYNSWNLDLRYSWWFAPGSQVTLLYRHAVDSYVPFAGQNFTQNFDHLFEQPQVNSLSLRLSYYLDYNRMKNWFKSGAQPEYQERDPKMGINY